MEKVLAIEFAIKKLTLLVGSPNVNTRKTVGSFCSVFCNAHTATHAQVLTLLSAVCLCNDAKPPGHRQVVLHSLVSECPDHDQAHARTDLGDRCVGVPSRAAPREGPVRNHRAIAEAVRQRDLPGHGHQGVCSVGLDANTRCLLTRCTVPQRSGAHVCRHRDPPNTAKRVQESGAGRVLRVPQTGACPFEPCWVDLPLADFVFAGSAFRMRRTKCACSWACIWRRPFMTLRS